MVAASCPKCSTRLKVTPGAIGKMVQCPCGHRFVLSDPAAEFLENVATAAEPGEARRRKSSFLKPPPGKKTPDRGPLICPYCSVLICEDVSYVGQTFACPKCHGQTYAPGGNQAVAANLRIVQTLLVIAAGISLLCALHGC
jgi:hypothetical protein